jgi:hypothetical protein
MLAKGAVVSLDAGRLEVARTLDLRHDLYLDDHRIDDKPVLPFAVAMELMAEAASAARPGSRLVVLRDIRLMRGVSLENDEPKPLKVAARPASASDVPSGCEALEVVVSSAESPPRLHYRALALLEKGTIADSLAPGPIRPLGEAGPLPLRLDEAYREWLFHGPIFQGIVSVDAIGAGGSSAILRTSSPGDCLAAADGSWLVDPVLVDCAFQVQLFWARLHWDITLLPSLVKDFRRVADAAGSPRGGSRLIRHEMRIGPANQAPMCQADHYFFEEDGRLLACLSGCEAVGSKALNRLAVGGRR